MELSLTKRKRKEEEEWWEEYRGSRAAFFIHKQKHQRAHVVIDYSTSQNWLRMEEEFAVWERWVSFLIIQIVDLKSHLSPLIVFNHFSKRNISVYTLILITKCITTKKVFMLDFIGDIKKVDEVNGLRKQQLFIRLHLKINFPTTTSRIFCYVLVYATQTIGVISTWTTCSPNG